MRKPELGIKGFTLDGFMNGGSAVEMRASAWLNVPKGMDNDPAANAALEQVRNLMVQHGISVRIQVQHKNGEDPRSWPRIGSFPLFPNRPNPQEVNTYQAPAQPLSQSLNDEVPF
jgi:hypothetical protein